MILSQSRNPISRQKSLAALNSRNETLVDWVRRLKSCVRMPEEQIIALGVRRGFLDEEMDAAIISMRVEDFKRSI